MLKRSDDHTLFFLSFFTQATADIIAVTIPILALYLHASPFEIGLLATSRGVVYAVCPFIAGYVLGKVNRKRVLLSATVINLVAALLFYFSLTPLELIAVRLFEGFSLAVFWPILESLIVKARVSNGPDPLRGFNMSWGFGQMIGPIIAGCVITFLDIRLPFLVAAGALIVNIALILRHGESTGQMPNEDGASLGAQGISLTLILTIAFLGAIASIFFAFFPVFGTSLGISAFELGVMLFFFGITRVFIFSEAPKIKAGLNSRILLASLGFFLVYLGNRLVMYAGVVLVGAALSMIYAYTLEHALRGDDLSVRRRAGMFEGLLGIGSMVGPFLAGVVAEFSYAYTFMMVVMASLLLVVGLKLSRSLSHGHGFR